MVPGRTCQVRVDPARQNGVDWMRSSAQARAMDLVNWTSPPLLAE
jgi:hypothetical protein